MTQQGLLRGGLRAKDASIYIGVGRTTFYKIVKDGSLPQGVTHPGTACVVWPVEVLDRYLEGLSVQPRRRTRG